MGPSFPTKVAHVYKRKRTEDKENDANTLNMQQLSLHGATKVAKIDKKPAVVVVAPPKEEKKESKKRKDSIEVEKTKKARANTQADKEVCSLLLPSPILLLSPYVV